MCNKRNYENTSMIYSSLSVAITLFIFRFIISVNFFVSVLILVIEILLFNIIPIVRKQCSFFLDYSNNKDKQYFNNINNIVKSFIKENSIDDLKIIYSSSVPIKITFFNVKRSKIKKCMFLVNDYISANLSKFSRIKRIFYTGIPILLLIIASML